MKGCVGLFKQIKGSFKNGISHTLPIVIGAAVALSSVIGLFIAGAQPEQNTPSVYYPLKGAVSKSGALVKDFYESSDWSFQGKDFGTGATAFETESEDFSKPAAETEKDGKSARVTWNGADGADEYRVNVLSGNAFIAGSPFITADTYADISGLRENSEYFVQVSAFKGGKRISSSAIGSFFTYGKAGNEKILIKGDSKSGTSNFKGVKEFEDGTRALYYTDEKAGWVNLIFGSGNTLSFGEDTKALAFRFGQEHLNGENGKWLSPAFKPLIDTTNNDSYSGSNVTVYYVTDDGEVFESGNSGNTRFNSLKYPQFKSGWVIIPSALFKSSYFKDDAKHRFILTVEQLYEISYDSAKNTYSRSQKQVTFSDYNLYFSDFCAVKDMNLFLKSLAYRGSEADKSMSVVYGHDVQSNNGFTISNKSTGTGYTFGYDDNGKTHTTLSYKLVNAGDHNYGMSLGFKAGESGVYDFSSLIKTENCKRNVDIYYRVLKEEEGGELSPLWPINGEWHVVFCTAANGYYTEIASDCTEAELKAGEKLRLEAYAEFADKTDGEIEIRLCNTSLVKTETSAAGSEKITEYSAAAYTDRFRNETAQSKGYYGSGVNRFNISAFATEDTARDLAFTSYSGRDGYFTEYESSGIGYRTDINGGSAAIVTSSSAKYGTAFTFLSPKSGVAELSFENPEGGSGRFRVLANGKQIYPETGWSEETGALAKSIEILAGDTVRLEHYVNKAQPAETALGDIKLTVTEKANTSNLPGNGYYSALWTRPFGGRVYNGAYDQAGNVWSFDLIDKNSQTLNGNMFSSRLGGLVYNSEIGTGAGYIFKNNEIALKLESEKSGAALCFKAPETGYYDYGYIFARTLGEGNVRYRLLHGDKTVNDPEVIPAGTEKINLSGEIFLKKDESLKLELFAETAVSPLEISLGAPTVIKGVSVTPNADGNIAAYAPAKFIRAENGYAGEIMLDGKRFEFGTAAGGNIYPLNTADYRTRRLYSKETGGGISLSGGELAAYPPAGGALRITYNPIRYGKTSIIAAPQADGSFSFTLKRLHGGTEEELFSGTGDSAYTVNADCTLENGDRLIFETAGAENISLGSIAINTAGVYPTANEPDSNIFIASLDYPYADEEYTGEYNDRSGIWSFGVLNRENGKFRAESVNYYDSEFGKHLYSKEHLSGYRFKDKFLYADITEKSGISLGFKAPYGGKFEFSAGLGTANAVSADIYYRLLKNGETVWPESGEWQLAAGADKNTDIEIPLLYFDLQEGDRVSLQIYSDKISGGDKAELALNSPQFRLYAPEQLSNSDFTASIFTPYSSVPFAGLDFEAGHTVSNAPASGSVWNFEFIDLLENGAVQSVTPRETKANEYKHQLTNDIISYKNRHNNPNYMVYGDKLELRVFTSLDKQSGSRTETAGESLRFVSPKECEAVLTGTPTLSRDLQAGQRVYFRILHNGKTVYPESGWEIFEGEKKKSDFTEMRLSLKKSDEIKYQFYTDADDGVLETYNGKTCNEIIAFSPSVAVTESVASSKSNFNFVNDMAGISLQLSPFWKTQYTYNIESPEWTNMEIYRSGWRYWTAAEENYIGISPTGAGEFWLSNNAYKTAENPAAAALYTAQANGYIQFNKMTVKMLKTDMFPAAQFRITKNCETVYPEDGGWQLIDDSTSLQLDETLIAIEKGDEIRFEIAANEPLENGKQLKVALNPKFIYSRYGAVYSKDKDIFGMLDKEMYSFFKGKAASEFDTAPQESRKSSQSFIERQGLLEDGWLARLLKIFGSEDGNTATDGEHIQETPGSDGYYIPGTSDKIIKRRRKITTFVSGGIPTYAVVLIAVGTAAVLTGGVTLLIIFIKRRKRRKVNVKL